MNLFLATWADTFMTKVIEFATSVGMRLLGALLILIIGFIVVGYFAKKVRKSSKMDPMLAKFSASFINFGGKTIVVITAIAVMGVEMTSFVALIASAGVAIGLALQGSLSNIAGGILLIVFKPFKVGDYILVGGEEGTVTDMNLFYTILKQPDNVTVSIPNGVVSNSPLENLSVEEIRRVDFAISTARDTDVERVKKLLIAVASSHELVLTDPAPFCRLSQFGENGIDFTLRVWVKKEDYWTVNFDIKEDIDKVFKHEGIKIPYRQVDIHMDAQDEE
ncbi:MAG: mechanosensitive ion channel [Clostridia bacterium]|nr:mechanosensitive ion channel [Clostridia bacterium]